MLNQTISKNNYSPTFYYGENDISVNDYDETIVAHPLIDACNMSIAYRLLEHLGIPCEGKTVLDVGTGTGQVCRLLKGIPGISIEACDHDPIYKNFFIEHPELKDIHFYCLDIMEARLEKKYDVAICRGVYHHIPKSKRPAFIKALCENAEFVIISDEGILEYSSPEERINNCNDWYNYVVSESKRRGLIKLAEIESIFWKNEYKNTADDGGDFKESPSHLLEDARQVGLAPKSLDKFGPWEEAKGGFFTVTFTSGR
jgi:SAM-dependent methyltransferase